MRAAFHTLGCKVNQYETNILMQYFHSHGYDVVEPSDCADIYIVNSCTVTSEGDRKTRQLLRRIRRENPHAVLALTGCFPQAFPEEAAALTEADVVTGSYNRASLPDALLRHLATGERVIDITPHKEDAVFEQMQITSFGEHTRAFIKIQDGCDAFCSYCIIPTARGPVRSKGLAQLKEELIALAVSGYREVVLVGINLCAYGRDTGASLYDAALLACTTHGIERVRLGSLEPQQLSPSEIRRLATLDRLCPQFHMSLQSGCDATLQRMNRQYDTAHYMELVQAIKESFKNPAVTTDVIAGFPGETREEFECSMDFVRRAGFARVHVFPYSARKGTPAAEMAHQIERGEVLERAREMNTAASAVRQAFLQTQIGTQAQVLFETRAKDGVHSGYTPNYTYVGVLTDVAPGSIAKIEITGLSGDTGTAKLI